MFRYETNIVGVTPGHHEIRGPPLIPYGRTQEDVTDRKILTKLDDGRFAFQHIEPTAVIPDDIILPGSDAIKAKKVCARKGYKLVKAKKEIATGKMVDLLVDTTSWMKPINDYLATLSDIMPKLPAVIVICGTINAGKSTIMQQLLQYFIHPNGIPDCHIMTTTEGLDGTLMTSEFDRHPDCTINITPYVDVDTMRKKTSAILTYLEPFHRAAKVGRYRKPKAKISAFKESQKDGPDPRHPYHYEDGSRHGHEIKRPVFARARLAETVPLLSSCSRHKGVIRRQRGARVLIRQSGPRELTGNALQDAVDINIERPSVSEAAAQHILQDLMFTDPKAYKKSQRPRPSFWYFEDASHALGGPEGSYLKSWITGIRHHNESAAFVIHKIKTIPTIIRSCATHVIIPGRVSDMDMQALVENFGAGFDDLEGLLHAATVELPGREKDFLMLDLKNKKAFRSWAGELVPACSE